MPKAGIPTAEAILEPSPMAQLRRRVLGHYGILIGGSVLLAIILMAIFAPLLTLTPNSAVCSSGGAVVLLLFIAVCGARKRRTRIIDCRNQ